MFAQLTYFDGPRTAAMIAASDRANLERIQPAMDAEPGLRAELVANYILRRPDGGEVIITLVKSEDALRRGEQVIMGTTLLPGEDPGLLPGPDRVEFYQVVNVVDIDHPFPGRAGGSGSYVMTHEVAAGQLTVPAPSGWTLDPGRSTASFAVRNLGFRWVRGVVPFESALVSVDGDGAAAVRAVFDLGAIATGNKTRDRDLRKPPFLDTATYPTMTFEGAGFPGSPLSGVLSIKGTTVAVDLQVELAANAADTIAVTATAGFDRTPLKLRAPRFMVGNWIAVTINAVFDRTEE